MSPEETTLFLARRGFSPADRDDIARAYGINTTTDFVTAPHVDWVGEVLHVPPPRPSLATRHRVLTKRLRIT